jgi:hypothetical protein
LEPGPAAGFGFFGFGFDGMMLLQDGGIVHEMF